MKKYKLLILTFLMFISLKTYSCECVEFGSFIKSFKESEFIAEITILDTFIDTMKQEKYAKIKINELYKGVKMNRIIFGSSEYVSSCDKSIKKGMRLIVYLKKHNNELSISNCDRIIYSNRIENEKQILKKNIENNENYNNGIFLFRGEFLLTYFYIVDIEEKFKLENRNAIYEIQLNFDNQVLNVKPIIGFNNNSLNEEITLNLEHLKWKKDKYSIENTKYLIEISHFTKKNNSKKQRLFYKNKFLITEY